VQRIGHRFKARVSKARKISPQKSRKIISQITDVRRFGNNFGRFGFSVPPLNREYPMDFRKYSSSWRRLPPGRLSSARSRWPRRSIRFARDFREAHDVITAGGIGTPQLMRSITRDPGLANPGAVPPWTIFTQTLIHDFDTINWLNPGSESVEVYATADALVAPDFKETGLLDTSVVVVKFDNGAIATTEANFSAVYGYDVRAEVFGSGGMVSSGDTALTGVTLHTAAGRTQRTVRSAEQLDVAMRMRPSSQASWMPFARARSRTSPVLMHVVHSRPPWHALSAIRGSSPR
jgi:hypothetical protein